MKARLLQQKDDITLKDLAEDYGPLRYRVLGILENEMFMRYMAVKSLKWN